MIAFSSSKDKERCPTGICLEAPACSNTDEQGRRDESSDGDPRGGGDPDDADGGVLASSGEGLPSAEGEHECLVPLLSSIASEPRARERERS
jgi:hypothetical protein